MKHPLLLGAAAIAGLTIAATPAQAHIVATRLGDFYTGGLHPLTGVEDVVQWLALGLVAGQQDVRRARWMVPVFPLALLAGIIGARLLHLPAMPEAIDAATMLVLGCLLAVAKPLNLPVLLGLTAIVGLLRGASNASGIGPDTDAVLFVSGLVLTGYAVVTLIAAAATSLLRGVAATWPAVAVRACGSWIAAVGLMLGGYALAAH
ncbi:HupE-UreJ family metal transporter [Rhodovastum atsumiense]|uniref:HupE/UreJ family protein n=1 Tax=Rhodovastum atsumiense TaxID=504468 RepID=A0A5M6IPK0_9PROT|nr:HupE/UreJ family protein [Rhodovastum atsumiense]KAA5609395.1 hypothetical protein F1189_24265 [Rhodovastum atsumiense]CAH2601850.1 HupE-UreJ family metal transporter [Rhodovastum atsumiense]